MALSFVAPEQVKFRYKLEGYDNEWQDAGNRRQAIYTNLPPRAYRFRLMASNNSGVWNEEGALLDFSIAPAFYQTTWFRLAILVLFLLLLWAAYQLRVRQLAHQFNMTLEARVSERTAYRARTARHSAAKFSGPAAQVPVGCETPARASRRSQATA